VRVAVFGAHAVAGAGILASTSHGTSFLITSEVGLARGVPDLLVRSGAREKGSLKFGGGRRCESGAALEGGGAVLRSARFARFAVGSDGAVSRAEAVSNDA